MLKDNTLGAHHSKYNSLRKGINYFVVSLMLAKHTHTQHIMVTSATHTDLCAQENTKKRKITRKIHFQNMAAQKGQVIPQLNFIHYIRSP